MKERRTVWDRIIMATDLGTEPSPKLPLVEIAGNRRVLIENHRGVSQYGSNEICVNVDYGCVYICGQKLDLLCMSKEQLIVTGVIESVRLCNGR